MWVITSFYFLYRLSYRGSQTTWCLSQGGQGKAGDALDEVPTHCKPHSHTYSHSTENWELSLSPPHVFGLGEETNIHYVKRLPKKVLSTSYLYPSSQMLVNG